MRRLKVFIAHSSTDRDWARSFALALREFEAEVWFDEFDIKPGDSIPEAVEAGLRGSDVVVMLVDKGSLAKPNFSFELGAAIGLDKRIVAIVSEESAATGLPLPLLRKKYLIRKSPEETARELAAGLELVRGEAA
jgi:nucleoside 2-deoxyribosyltransferase